MRKALPVLAAFGFAAGIALAAQPQAWAEEQDEELETLLVVGEQPGPGLWKVSRGDHVMWVLASNSQLQARVVWNSRRAEARLAESQEVLLPPSVQVEPSIGVFKMLTLIPAIPSVLKIDKNPGGAKLKDMLPPATHARWLVLRDKYYFKFPGKNGKEDKKDRKEDVEEQRPLVAIMMLNGWAMVKSGLGGGPRVEGFVNNAAKKHNVRINRLPAIRRAVKVEGSFRGMAKEAAKVLPAELACFERSLDVLEPGLELAKQRANAWALGDIQKLRELHGAPRGDECILATTRALVGQDNKNAASAKKMLDSFMWHDEQGRAQAQRDWVAAAQVALEKNPSTFTVLYVDDIFRAGGHLDALRTLGYMVEEPL